ncbi:hypothetical protein K493DRAFT_311872 [Basidiobolus meristosporus CBS 931.73]|uniref:DUF7789 domain-containing protein n=1 Tax=Basidiobolus meristosporus CBS 931.73 TaxID=1314790 RepID=A0A1Y1YY76_9FUNG|nr:hypothetical protein K493DRAFT_311872 [Basidiobolus meristosporus CBS 931.73]|eukprot:ORY02983.1 hypothetical protein K493DRAFT_311872 [Basidiobolus meristosporus CBS 931.73]
MPDSSKQTAGDSLSNLNGDIYSVGGLAVNPKKKPAWIPSSTWSRVAVLVAALQGIAVTALEIVITVNRLRLDINDEYNSIIIYHVIMMAAQLFAFILCWEAMVHKNTIQAIAFTIFNYILLGFSVILYLKYRSIQAPEGLFEDTRLLDLAVIIVITSCSVAFTGLTWEIYKEFGWKIFKRLGANLEIRRMYKAYQILLTLLKLDVFFFIGYSVQLATLVYNSDDVETWIQLTVAIPGSVVLLALAFYGLHKEKKLFMYIFMACLALVIVYCIYKFVKMYQPDNRFANSREYLTFFNITTIILIITTMVNTWICCTNFGKGLREQIEAYDERRNSTSPRLSQGAQMIRESGCNSERWEID